MNKTNEKIKKKMTLEYCYTFGFAYRENAECLVLALSSSGYMAKMAHREGAYWVEVYKRI